MTFTTPAISPCPHILNYFEEIWSNSRIHFQLTPMHGLLRPTKEAFVLFLMEQHKHFDAQAWLEYDEVDATDKAFMAAFLARQHWYGHQEELMALSKSLCPSGEALLGKLSKLSEVDPQTLAGLVKGGLRYE